VAAHALELALGRRTAETRDRRAVDQMSIDGLTHGAFAGGELPALLTALVTSPSFLHRDARQLPGGAP
jgi:hypothetical protein